LVWCWLSSDIRRATSNYGQCMGVYGINTTCVKQPIFVESTDECNMYGDTAYGGVLRCDLTRQFGRPRNAYVLSIIVRLDPLTFCLLLIPRATIK
jgi:hypothetical protein